MVSDPSASLSISIIIPSRNEVEDIAATLDAVVAIDYDPKEIIVVDDSTDETPEIVASYADRGVRLVHREHNRNGCCGARNLGMQMANGDIVVLMNADNRPHQDFCRRILVHYRNGADYVIVGSKVKNTENIWGRYIWARGQVILHDHPEPTWSEGFSCRRAVVKAIGYIPGDFPIPFCRDVLLGTRLEQAGFKKVYDPSIPMEHISPAKLPDYWRNQVWRGSVSAPYVHYFRKMPVPWVAVREGVKAVRTVVLDLLLLPPLWRTFRRARYTEQPWRSFPGLLGVSLVQDAAVIVGNLKGLMRLARMEWSQTIRPRCTPS